jgi:hypothetical protein
MSKKEKEDLWCWQMQSTTVQPKEINMYFSFLIHPSHCSRPTVRIPDPCVLRSSHINGKHVSKTDSVLAASEVHFLTTLTKANNNSMDNTANSSHIILST